MALTIAQVMRSEAYEGAPHPAVEIFMPPCIKC